MQYPLDMSCTSQKTSFFRKLFNPLKNTSMYGFDRYLFGTSNGVKLHVHPNTSFSSSAGAIRNNVPNQ